MGQIRDGAEDHSATVDALVGEVAVTFTRHEWRTIAATLRERNGITLNHLANQIEGAL